MAHNPSDPGWIETEEVRGSIPPWRQRDRQRQPMTWPLAAFGLGVLLFLGWVVWLVVGLIRDLAG